MPFPVNTVENLGFEVEVELTLDSGRELWVQMTREEANALELLRGQIVWLRPSRSTSFLGRAEAPDRPEAPAASC